MPSAKPKGKFITHPTEVRGYCRACGRTDVNFCMSRGYLRQKCNMCRKHNKPTIYVVWDKGRRRKKIPSRSIKKQIDAYFKNHIGYC